MNSESAEYSLSWEGHIQHVKKAFNRILHNNELCDVTLYAEGQKIGAHKVFLSACSKYFDQLFKDFKDERPVIVLKGVQFDILQHILNFVYRGQANIEVYQLKQFLETAAFLKIDGLADNSLKRRRNTSFDSDDTNDPRITLDAQPEVAKKVQQSPLKNTCPKPSKVCKIYHSPNKNQNTSNVNYPDFSKAPVIGKYPVDTPAGEWLSEYEIQSQSSIADSILDEDTNPLIVEHTNENPVEHPDIVKITVIKSEPIDEKIDSDIEEISFNETDFSDSLDAEIELSEDGEDGVLEKHLLKTPLASRDEKGYYLCTICEKSYVKKDSLKKHFAIHVNNTTCTICGKVLSRKTHLIRHYLLAHKLSSK